MTASASGVLKSSSRAATSSSHEPPGSDGFRNTSRKPSARAFARCERLVRVVHRLAPVRSEKQHEQRLRPPLVERVPQRDHVAERLRHLLAAEAEDPVVHPELRELTPRAARLGDLVLVVREDEIEPTAVDLEHRPEVLLGHRRALDVPTGATAPPRRVPPRVLALLVPLPEREVAWALLQRGLLLLLGRVAHGVLVEPARESAVLGKAVDTEVDVAAGRVREAELDQLRDQRDDLGNRLRRLRLVVGPAQAEVLRVLDVPLRRVSRELRAVPGRGQIDLVVDVRDVLDQRHVVALVLEPALEPHRDDERPRVADVDPLVDGRAAEVHADRAGRRGQLVEPAGRGVIEPHRPASGSLPGAARRRSPTARGPARARSARAGASAGRRRPPSARG